MIPEPTLSKLIQIGNSLEWDDPTLLSRLEPIKTEDHINRLHWREWYAVADKLSLDEIVSLLRGLVAAEEKLRWSGGSVSATIWVFRALERRDEILANKVGDWILQHTSNSYFPYFGWGKTIEEARRNKADWEAKKRDNYAVEMERQKVAKVRREQQQMERKSEHERRLLRQKEAKVERESIISKIRALTPKDRLVRLANDSGHPIQFFPSEFAQVNDELLETMDESTRIQLLEKLKGVAKGPWKQFRIRLESLNK
jgi:hypothetical protein